MIKTKLSSLFILTLFTINSFAQNSWITKLPVDGEALKMIKTSNGGFAAMSKFWNGEYSQRNLAKLNSEGGIEWVKEIKSPDTSWYFADFIESTNDGYVLVGKNYKEPVGYAILIELNSYGDTVLTFSYSENETKIFTKIVSFNNGIYSFLGGHLSPGNFYIHKYDISENLLEVDSSERFTNVGYGIYNYLYNKDGNYFMWKNNNPNDTVLYTDSELNRINVKSYNFEKFSVCKPDNDGGYILADYWYTYLGSTYNDGYVFKIDENLDSLWAFPVSSYHTPGLDYDYPDITPTNDGGYIMAGNVGNELFNSVYMIKLDANGNKLWHKSYAAYPFTRVKGVVEADDGGIVMFIDEQWHYLGTNLFLVKTKADGTLNIDDIEKQDGDFSLYPNPANDVVNLSFTEYFSGNANIFDISGKILFVADIEKTKEKQISISFLPKGIYFIKLTSKRNNISIIKKIIKL